MSSRPNSSSLAHDWIERQRLRLHIGEKGTSATSCLPPSSSTLSYNNADPAANALKIEDVGGRQTDSVLLPVSVDPDVIEVAPRRSVEAYKSVTVQIRGESLERPLAGDVSPVLGRSRPREASDATTATDSTSGSMSRWQSISSSVRKAGRKMGLKSWGWRSSKLSRDGHDSINGGTEMNRMLRSDEAKAARCEARYAMRAERHAEYDRWMALGMTQAHCWS